MSFSIDFSNSTNSLAQYEQFLGKAERDLECCRKEDLHPGSARDYSTLCTLIKGLADNLPRLKIDQDNRKRLLASVTRLQEGAEQVAKERGLSTLMPSHPLRSMRSLQASSPRGSPTPVLSGSRSPSPILVASSSPSSSSLASLSLGERPGAEDVRIQTLKQRFRHEELLAGEQCKALIRELETLTSRQPDRTQEIQAEKTRLSSELDALRATYREEIALMKQEAADILAPLSLLEAQLGESSIIIEEQQQRYDALRDPKIVEANLKKIQDLDNQKRTAEAAFAELSDSLSDMVATKEELEKRLTPKIDSLTDEIEVLSEPLAALIHEQAESANLTSAAALTDSGILRTDQVNSLVQQSITSQREHIESLNRQRQTLQKELSELSDDHIANANAQLQELRATIASFSTQMEKVFEEEAGLNRREIAARQELEIFQKEHAELEEELRRKAPTIVPLAEAAEKRVQERMASYDQQIGVLADSLHDAEKNLEILIQENKEALAELVSGKEAADRERERLIAQNKRELADLTSRIEEERAKAQREAASSSTSSSSSSSRVPAPVTPMSGIGLADLPATFTLQLDSIAEERNPATRSRLIRERLKAADIRKADLRELYIAIGSPHTRTQDYLTCEHFCFMHIGNHIEPLKAFIADKKRPVAPVAPA